MLKHELDKEVLEATTPAGGGAWELSEDPVERGNMVQTTFDQIMDEQSEYRTATLQHLRLYRNLNTLAYAFAVGTGRLSAPLSLNVIRNMTNAVHSKITKNRVKTTMQTTGAGWERRELAKKLEAYGLGLTLKENLHLQTKRSALDAIVTGCGHVKTVIDKPRKRVFYRRVFSPYLVVDLAEGAFMTPPHKYEIMYVDRGRLMRKYKDDKEKCEKIRGIPKSTAEDDGLYVFQDSPSADYVRVVEANYVNPDDPEDGFRSLVAGGVELEGFKVTSGCQYTSLRWAEGNIGWYGMGLAEELKGIQLEINRLVRKIQTAQGLFGTPIILADKTSAIARGQFTDVPGIVINYVGKEPKVVAPQTVHPEIFAQLDRLYQRAYEIAGVSQLSSQSKNPEGFESGRQMLVHLDIESDRFADFQRAWEEMHVECIRKGIIGARTISKYSVPVWNNDDGGEELDFKEDINLDDDEWTIHPMATKLLGETPPAQMDNMERLIKMGVVDHPEDMLDQIDAPDVKAYLKRKTSGKRVIEKMVGTILKTGTYIPPEPQLNLALALDTAQEMYLEAKLNGYPPKRLELVRQFMVRCKNLIKIASVASDPTSGAVAAPGGPPPIPTGPAPGPEAAPAIAAA